MPSDNKQLTITIGATLSAAFNSVISGSTSKLQQVGNVIKGLEKQSTLSATAIGRLKTQYNSLLGSINRQQAILGKRANFQSQIMDVVALGASLAAPINSAMKFESAMADVHKVVNYATEDGAEKLTNALKELSRTIPISVEGLAQITAAGGQLGVQEKDLTSFTTNVAKMSTAFDMLPNEAGTAMATLSNVFDIPITQLTELGDAINHVSNNSAAPARLIVPALARAGGAARQFGLSAQQATAFVGTLIAMGKAPEVAGTATAAILQRLQTASKSGPKVAAAFRKVGMSVNVFTKLIGEDAQGTLVKFFDLLEKVDKQERSSILVDIFGREYSGTIATMVGSLNTYRKQLNLIAKPSDYAGSMEKEFKTRAATTENAVQLLQNSLSELSIALGDSLLPAVNGIVSSIKSVLQSITGWITANPELTRTITTAIAGLISFKLATFVAGYASTFLFGGLNKVIIVLKGLRLGLSLAGVAFKSFLGWPMALATAAFAIWQNWDTVQSYLQNIWSVVAPYWRSFKALMNELGITEPIVNAWNGVKSFFASIWKSVEPGWNNFLGKVKELGFVQYIIDAWNKLKTFFKNLWDDITPSFDSITKPLSNLWDRVKSIMPDFGNSAKITATPGNLKLPDVKQMAPNSTRTQNNNFTINVQAAKNDDAETLSKKVVNRVSEFSKAFLYDSAEVA